MGFVSPGNQCLTDDLGVELNERGFVKRIEGNATTIPGIFVAGDIASGPSLVVRAMQDGKDAAEAIKQHLVVTQ